MSEHNTAERWWRICAYNQTAEYGYGTRQEAEQYADFLDRRDGREINLHTAEPVEPDEAAELDADNPPQRDDGFNLADAIGEIQQDDD